MEKHVTKSKSKSPEAERKRTRGGELCLIEKIIRVGLLTVWGIFGALVEALTIACYLCEGVWSEVVRELWNHPTSESRSGRRDTGPGRYRHLLSLCLLVVRGK